MSAAKSMFKHNVATLPVDVLDSIACFIGAVEVSRWEEYKFWCVESPVPVMTYVLAHNEDLRILIPSTSRTSSNNEDIIPT